MIRFYLTLISAASLAFAVNTDALADAGDNASEWTLSPTKSDDGLTVPSNAKAGVAYIGRGHSGRVDSDGRTVEPGKDGDPHSYVEKTVKCTDGEAGWCTTILNIGFFQRNEERLQITLTANDGTSTVVYLKKDAADNEHPNDPSTHEATLSSKGCKSCKIKIEIVTTSKSTVTDRIQSRGSVQVNSYGAGHCTEKSKMNNEGRLVDKDEKAVSTPQD